MQLKISRESTKFGLTFKQIEEIIKSDEYQNLTHVKVCGIMAMASFTNNIKVIKNEFDSTNDLFEKIKKTNTDFNVLSMGMSNDYKLAINCGSNMVRIGSLIFGSRNY